MHGLPTGVGYSATCIIRDLGHYTRHVLPVFCALLLGAFSPIFARSKKTVKIAPGGGKGGLGTLLAAFAHGPRYLRPTSDGQTWNNRGYQVVLARYMHQAGFQFGPISVTKRPGTAR